MLHTPARTTLARTMLAAGVILAAGLFGASSEAEAGYTSRAQWCVRAYDGADECFYRTYAQCHAAMWGTGGTCVLNPHFIGEERPYRKPRRYRS